MTQSFLTSILNSFAGNPVGASKLKISTRDFSEVERYEIRTKVHQAAEAIPRSWPLRSFVYRNVLQGFEHLPFDEAVRQGQALLGGRGYLPNETYRELYRAGRITDTAIQEALNRAAETYAEKEALVLGSRSFEATELRRVHLIYGIEGLNRSIFDWKSRNEDILGRFRSDVPSESRISDGADHLLAIWNAILSRMGLSMILDEDIVPKSNPQGSRLREMSRIGRHQTLAEWIRDHPGSDLVDSINRQMIKWCASFLDEGLSVWGMPCREKGFYGAWKVSAGYDSAGRFIDVPDLSERVRELPNEAEEALVGALEQLGIPKDLWTDYLRRHLVLLPGWTMFMKWRSNEPDYPPQSEYPMDLTGYLAVRLVYEAFLVDAHCQREWGVPGNVSKLNTFFRHHPESYPAGSPRSEDDSHSDEVSWAAWRFFQLAQFLGLNTAEVNILSRDEINQALRALDAFPTDQHGPVWLDALERSYRRVLLPKLSIGDKDIAPTSSIRSRVQSVFCIDARSEGFRRHLEALGGYETFGFAGFFGVPICFKPYGEETEVLLCPALMKPKQRVAEVSRAGHEDEDRRYKLGSRWKEFRSGLFHDLKANNLSSFPLIDLLAPWFGSRLLGKTLFPSTVSRWEERLRQWLVPAPPTSLRLDRSTEAHDDPALAQWGFTLDEQATFVENALRMTGLTKGFARLILYCGHGGRTENNPYAAAYDCGACGGQHGGPNARALAAMANRQEVRDRLRDRGIEIPADTVFIAGEHNTTTDTVTLLDLSDHPDSHRDDLAQLGDDLKLAGIRQAQERLRRLPGAPVALSPEAAVAHAQGRGRDWAQIRPEWGLSGNAAFVIGRRSLTQDANLEGRVFLHSYDPDQDKTGRSLETIMTAPLLVVQWIAMEYYFSSVDHWRYGSGSKVFHNVVGGIGVMIGREGDLAGGLPMQSVINGSVIYHEPMRPLTVIEAPRTRVVDIIGRHEILGRLFNNRWINLIVIDPEYGQYFEYKPGGSWVHLSEFTTGPSE